jgi:hypothetical protein
MNDHRGGVYWTPSFLRSLILDDVYRPHVFSEIAAMVAPEVAARLDESEHYAAKAPEALDSLIPEERHRLYRMLRITVIVQPDTTLEVSGVFGEGLSVSNQGLVS